MGFFMKRSKSSQRWLQEHHRDPYVKLAKQQGMRSRAAFKLQEFQQKYRCAKPGDTVIDLGAAPGSWSALLAEWVGVQGKVIALDLLPIAALPGVTCIQGDFSEDAVLSQLVAHLNQRAIHLVTSDIAPNMSGIKSADQARAMYLAELVLEFTQQYLSVGGNFLIKLFQGQGFDNYLTAVRPLFKKIVLHKPEASRDRSTEVYLLALYKK